jgi:hypothetical protein
VVARLLASSLPPCEATQHYSERLISPPVSGSTSTDSCCGCGYLDGASGPTGWDAKVELGAAAKKHSISMVNTSSRAWRKPVRTTTSPSIDSIATARRPGTLREKLTDRRYAHWRDRSAKVDSYYPAEKPCIQRTRPSPLLVLQGDNRYREWQQAEVGDRHVLPYHIW